MARYLLDMDTVRYAIRGAFPAHALALKATLVTNYEGRFLS